MPSKIVDPEFVSLLGSYIDKAHVEPLHLKNNAWQYLAYLGVRLRDCVSLFNRFDITLDQISQLSVACCEHFNVNAMFMQSSVNPTVWTLGHIVPAHCSQVFEKYGQGLGMVTMEGREAKHIF